MGRRLLDVLQTFFPFGIRQDRTMHPHLVVAEGEYQRGVIGDVVHGVPPTCLDFSTFGAKKILRYLFGTKAQDFPGLVHLFLCPLLSVIDLFAYRARRFADSACKSCLCPKHFTDKSAQFRIVVHQNIDLLSYLICLDFSTSTRIVYTLKILSSRGVLSFLHFL